MGSNFFAIFWMLHCTKMKFSIKNFFSKCDLIDKTADLVSFTEEIFNRKFHFLCGETCYEVSLMKLRREVAIKIP